MGILCELQKKLLDIRRENQAADRYFYPYQAVKDIMNEGAFRKALQHNNTEVAQIKATVEYTRFQIEAAVEYTRKHGAHRTMAVLVMIERPRLFLNIISHGDMQNSNADHRLPHVMAFLEQLLPEAAAREFFERQWEFAAPIFSDSTIRHVLHKKTILPFVGKEQAPVRGAFGQVFEVDIEPSHRPVEEIWQRKLVRKETEASGQEEFEQEQELCNLSMLRFLKHPNLVQMLAAYTHNNKHNLIFPMARHKTLGDLLEGQRPSQFDRNETFTLALVGLCSAVHAVHYFAAHRLDLSAIGCHHDLKPDNVLVDNTVFILTDFGLSTFKDSAESSRTQHKHVHGHYIAPECEDFENLSQDKFISRPSDMWSLGCIILEVLTYAISEAEGVKDFFEKRVFKVAEFKRHRFHQGVNQAAPAVTAQLENIIQNSPNWPEKSTGILARDMLQLKPENRPKAPEVDARMMYIALAAVSADVYQQYYTLMSSSQDFQARLVLHKFTGWWRVCKLDKQDQNGWWSSPPYPDYQLVQDALLSMRRILAAIPRDYKADDMYPYQHLHALNDDLLRDLPDDLEKQARTEIRFSIADSSDKPPLDRIAQDLRLTDFQAELSVLVKVKQLTQLVEAQSLAYAPELCINPQQIEAEQVLLNHRTKDSGTIDGQLPAKLKLNDGELRKVLVERKRYAKDVGQTVLKELIDRLSGIAMVLREALRQPDLRLLPCLGFYHDPDFDSCGLIYDYPPQEVSTSELKFTTLKNGLELSSGKHLPILDSRFKLARDLSTSLLRFHEAQWLQKSISSFNVGFFHHEHDEWMNGMNEPYVFGFVNSRQSSATAYTEFIFNVNQQDYQHPRYREGKGSVRYQPQYDYYSLGLILLEIGRWKSVESMLAGKKGSPDDDRGYLLKTEVPRLGQGMGSTYKNVVNTCLSGEVESAEATSTPITGKELHSRFSEMVVRQLEKCTV